MLHAVATGTAGASERGSEHSMLSVNIKSPCKPSIGCQADACHGHIRRRALGQRTSELRAVSEAEPVSRIGREIQAIRRRRWAGKIESAAVRSRPAGARESRRECAGSEKNVPGARTVAAAILPAGRTARDVQNL